MDQALAFLIACANTPRPLAPSAEVDLGWHTFLLYTNEYADFCERIAGRFIHHRPKFQLIVVDNGIPPNVRRVRRIKLSYDDPLIPGVEYEPHESEDDQA